MSEKKQCLECGNELMGRIDKKFCSDGCRNAYHNKVNPATKNLIRNIIMMPAIISNMIV